MALSVAVLKNIDFRRLVGARSFGMFGLQAQAVIVGWQVYTLTESVFMLGLVGLVEAVPAIIMSFLSGHIVDISRPHRVYILSVASLMLISLGLLLVAGEVIVVNGNFLLYFIFGAVFLSGVARSFIVPASFTLLSQIVPKSNIPAASAWMSSGFQFAAIAGPAIGGIVYGGYGHFIAWLIPFSFLFMALMMAISISHPHRHYRSSERREPAVASIKAGWKFIFSNRILLSVMSLDMFAVLFGGAVAILPAFADQILAAGSEGLGLLRAAPAIGSIATALYMALNPMKDVKARTLLWVVVGFGVSIIGFGFSTSLGMAAFFLAISGAFDSVSMVIRGTLMQLLVPDAMRGRVSAVNGMFIISSNEIGAFRAGSFASLLGLVPSIVIGGFATLGIVGATAVLAPKMRTLVVSTEEKKA